MQLRLLSDRDVHRAVSMVDAIQAMRSAFGQLSGGRASSPVRTAVTATDGVALFMPAHLPDEAALGAKIVSVFPENRARGLPAIHAIVVLIDDETGEPRAALNGTYLTALRTGAVSGLATDLLARPDATILTCFGAAVQARTQVQAVRAVRDIREVRLVSRTRTSAELFAAELEDVRVTVHSDPCEAVAGADVIVTATDSHTPVFPGNEVDPGTHVNAIGSFTPAMQEVDADLVLRSVVVVDSREAALEEAGDLIVPLRSGLISADHIQAELGDVVNGVHGGRGSPQDITYFKSVGNAVQDLAVAARALSAAEAEGLGTLVDF